MNSTLFTTMLNQSVDGARQGFTALAGDVYATTQTVQADQSQILRNAILRRLAQATYSESTGNGLDAQGALGLGGPETYASTNAYATGAQAAFPAKAPAATKGAYVAAPNDLTFWTQGLGGFGHVDGDGNAPSANGTFAGVITGVDTAFGHATRAGFAAGYIRSDLRSGASSASVDSAQIAAYAGHDVGPLHARGGVSYAFDVINSDRMVAFPGLLDLDRARFNGNVAQLFGEIGYGLMLGRVALEPVAGLADVRAQRGTFVESGGTAALNGAAVTENIGYSSLGLRAATSVSLADGTALTPHASALWQHAFGDINPATAVTFQTTGTTFSTASVPITKDAALVQGGITWLFSPLTRVSFDYQGTISSTAQSHLVKAVFSRSF
jgi:outer membrane autotransporter protein